jgi:hypothetical protein
MRRLTVVVLVLGSIVAAQKLQTKGTEMQTADNISVQELTETISARLVAQWDGWKNQNAASNNAIIADDFTTIWPDGSSTNCFEPYRLERTRPWSPYFAEVKIPGDNVEHQKEFQMAVGEFWVKRNGQWVIRGYSGTLMK